MLNSNLHSLFEIEVPEEAPFQNDRLNRQPFAEAIKNLIDTFSGGVVISINGKWGTGKSKFIEMFSKNLWNGEKPYCNTILNVWEHEYFDNPTLAILSSIKQIFYQKSLYNMLFLTLFKSFTK